MDMGSEESLEHEIRTTSREAELEERLYWLIRLRWLAVLGVVVAITAAGRLLGVHPPRLGPTYLLAGAIALYNCLFWLWLRWSRGDHPSTARSRGLANVQIAMDLMALTLLLHYSGGVENPLAFFFVFHIIIASILLSQAATFAQATLATGLFGGMVVFERYGLLTHHHLSHFMPSELYRSAFMWGLIVVFVATLYLSAYMATSITTRLRQREHEILELSEERRQTTHRLHEAYDRLAATQQLQAQYLRRTSHELRMPLSAIQSLMEVVLGGITGEMPPKARELIERANVRTGQLLRLVNDLLILLRSQTGKLDAQMAPVHLPVVLDRVIELQRGRAESKYVGIEMDLPPNLPPVLGDTEALEQLMTNLTANAVKYTPAGGHVIVDATSDGQYVRVRIRDTGIGIPEEDLPKIFDEFYRSPRARQFAEVGTGLGLSIVQSIVDAHHGSVRVESKVDEGSTFEVSLPVARTAAGASGNSLERSQE